MFLTVLIAQLMAASGAREEDDEGDEAWLAKALNTLSVDDSEE